MENFSINSAIECADEMFKALPKKKQMEYLGALNEIFVVLGKVPCKDKDKEYNPKDKA